ncbi:MAG: NTP transferase domain-containing protein [Treponema sp.]|jgi:NDP-sugar pyrophosphorylase family protein|nr:NTP transferase domain-containing protein [Treponema sp.]
MKGPVLVVLAAGMGSRYGGLKQLDRIGAGGEALLDYSVFDALRAGFKKVVFIIRHAIEQDFKDLVLSRMRSIPYELCFQELDSLIPAEIYTQAAKAGRSKPWGTSHALLCAAPLIDAPFAVINADDFYGSPAFQVMGSYLASPQLTEGALVPYRLDKTLSPQGTVTRGVCVVREGYLESVQELTAIAQVGSRIVNTSGAGVQEELAPDTPVSMNFWGFPAGIFPDLRRYFDAFLEAFAGQPKPECYLPMAADWFIKHKLLKIRVLPADSPWFGVTYQEDRIAAVKRIAELTAQGLYSPSLWTS